jgi:phage tail-like protein
MTFGRLDIQYANGSTAAFDLTKRQVTIGRASDVDVPLSDGQISRRHAILLCGPEGVRLVDAGSINGTYLGANRLPAQQPIPLTDGVVLRMGSTQVRFTARAGQAEPAAPEPAALSAPGNPPRREFDTAIKPPSAAPGDTRPPEPHPVVPPPAFTPPPPDEPVLPVAEESRDDGPPPGVPSDRSSYLKFLPAIYSGDDFLGRFLLIFESILSPIDRTIDNLHFYFDAAMAPAEFLPWLASWLGLVLDERWPEAQRRALIRAAVDLYQWRGTRRGLADFLQLYTGHAPEIVEPGVGRQRVGAEEAFRFIVRLRVPDPSAIDRGLVEAIIIVEKPAHAGYALEIIQA